MEEWAKCLSAKTEASLARTETIRKLMESKSEATISSVSNSSSVAECQKILDSIPDLDDQVYIKAIDKFIKGTRMERR
ncbi:hypothetical protein TorRG33x02_232470, partial [Trema orientale]